MAIEKRTINELREAIKECIGQNAILKTAEGRNRIGHVEGTLVGAYHDYFLVRENKNGTISLSGLDFANNTYNIKLVLEYKNDAGRIVILESEVLTYEASNNTPAPNPSPSGGCSMGSVKLFISLSEMFFNFICKYS